MYSEVTKVVPTLSRTAGKYLVLWVGMYLVDTVPSTEGCK